MQDYQELKTLGRGSFGKAVLVARKRDNKLLVLKKMHAGPDILKSDPELEQEQLTAEKEIQVLQKLNHEHVVRYHDAFSSGKNSRCIVMEYCSEGCLQDLIEAYKVKARKGMPEVEALDIFVQLLLGMQYVHNHKVLHRDLKPANIFLSPPRMVKIGDFGVARQFGSNSNLANTIVGTPYYLAPELCKGEAYNHKVDVWSLGCVLHELLTGQHAFPGHNLPMIIISIVKGNRSDITDDQASPEVQTLLNDMIQLNPTKRPDVADILALPFIKAAHARLQARTRSDSSLETLPSPSSSLPRLSFVNELSLKEDPHDMDHDEEASMGEGWSSSLDRWSIHSMDLDPMGTPPTPEYKYTPGYGNPGRPLNKKRGTTFRSSTNTMNTDSDRDNDRDTDREQGYSSSKRTAAGVAAEACAHRQPRKNLQSCDPSLDKKWARTSTSATNTDRDTLYLDQTSRRSTPHRTQGSVLGRSRGGLGPLEQLSNDHGTGTPQSRSRRSTKSYTTSSVYDTPEEDGVGSSVYRGILGGSVDTNATSVYTTPYTTMDTDTTTLHGDHEDTLEEEGEGEKEVECLDATSKTEQIRVLQKALREATKRAEIAEAHLKRRSEGAHCTDASSASREAIECGVDEERIRCDVDEKLSEDTLRQVSGSMADKSSRGPYRPVQGALNECRGSSSENSSSDNNSRNNSSNNRNSRSAQETGPSEGSYSQHPLEDSPCSKGMMLKMYQKVIMMQQIYQKRKKVSPRETSVTGSSDQTERCRSPWSVYMYARVYPITCHGSRMRYMHLNTCRVSPLAA